ncbi:MAG: hypothetical protein ACM31C_08585 [Acidobacteriota bacterium]
MIRTLAIAVLACSLGACKGDKAQKSPAADFRDQMCGCKAKSGDRMIREDCAANVEAAWKDAKAKATGDGDAKAEQELAACRDEIRKDFEAAKASQPPAK